MKMTSKFREKANRKIISDLEIGTEDASLTTGRAEN
jgi:hypothetical protein